MKRIMASVALVSLLAVSSLALADACKDAEKYPSCWTCSAQCSILTLFRYLSGWSN